MVVCRLVGPLGFLALASSACFSDPPGGTADSTSSSTGASASSDSSSSSEPGTTSTDSSGETSGGSSSTGFGTAFGTTSTGPTSATDTEPEASSSSTGRVPRLECDEGFLDVDPLTLGDDVQVSFSAKLGYTDVGLVIIQDPAVTSLAVVSTMAGPPFVWEFGGSFGNEFSPGVAVARFSGLDGGVTFEAECELLLVD